MHYLEDYLEIIELLPAELKSRFLQLKELDEHVQSQLESLNDRSKTFFTLCRKNKQELREQQYQSLSQEYEKVVRDSAEKVKLANQINELLDRHMRRMDQDLSRFTIELEADTAGITEILEQRSYLLDRPPTPERPQAGQKRTRHNLQMEDFTNGDYDDYSPSHSTRSSPNPIGRGHKYPRRERTSTWNIHEDTDYLAELDEQLTSPSSFYAGTGGKPPLVFAMAETKSHKKKSSAIQQAPAIEVVQESTDWLNYVDSDEPRYCLCNQVSYGEMVACDNPDCPIEWFHYGCVGITDPPKGKWYCPQCTLSVKKKGNRKGTT